jgi:hypothetical protein
MALHGKLITRFQGFTLWHVKCYQLSAWRDRHAGPSPWPHITHHFGGSSMKRVFSLLILCGILVLAGNAFAFEAGEEVEVCNTDGAYALMDAETQCSGDVLAGQVVEVRETEIDVKINDQDIITLPVQ